jgi:hypothetical protein
MPKAGIDGYPVYPGADLGFFLEPVEAFPDVDEHFLEDIPSVMLVANITAADPIDPVFVRFDCRLELSFLVHRVSGFAL